MSSPCYIVWAADTSASTGPPATVATAAVAGTAKTILQVRPPTDSKIRVIEWGYTLDTAPAAPLRVELVETGLVYATVTTIGSGVRTYSDASGSASTVQTGTTHTGFNASAEGTITSSRLLAYQYESGLYFKQQFPLGREPDIQANASLRIRATPTSAAAVNMQCYIIFEA
jgi:hypothetical protein